MIHVTDVTYGFTNRTPHMKLSRAAYKWLVKQINSKQLCPYVYEFWNGTHILQF
jgi:hypothetical protein